MLQNYNFYRVLTVFLDNPTKGFGWRELSKIARLGPPSVKMYLDDIIKEGVVVEKKTAGRRLYFANRESRKYRLYKTFDTLLRLENSDAISALNEAYGHPTIILFGSYATGEAVEESDIDIAVITESKKHIVLKQFEKSLKKDIQLMRLSRDNLKSLKKANPSLYNGIISGIVISGRLEVA